MSVTGCGAWPRRRRTAGCARRSTPGPRRTSAPSGTRSRFHDSSPSKTLAVLALVLLGLDRGADGALDLLVGRPDVAQVDGLAVLVVAERLVVQVGVDAAGERVGDHQHRRRQKVHAHQRVDAPLEVAVARQHRGDDQIALGHGLGDRLRQRARVADAGGAAVADEVEAEPPPDTAISPASFRYSVTTREPGASEVLTHGFGSPAPLRSRSSPPGPRPASPPGSTCWCTR